MQHQLIPAEDDDQLCAVREGQPAVLRGILPLHGDAQRVFNLQTAQINPDARRRIG